MLEAMLPYEIFYSVSIGGNLGLLTIRLLSSVKIVSAILTFDIKSLGTPRITLFSIFLSFFLFPFAFYLVSETINVFKSCGKSIKSNAGKFLINCTSLIIFSR